MWIFFNNMLTEIGFSLLFFKKQLPNWYVSHVGWTLRIKWKWGEKAEDLNWCRNKRENWKGREEKSAGILGGLLGGDCQRKKEERVDEGHKSEEGNGSVPRGGEREGNGVGMRARSVPIYAVVIWATYPTRPCGWFVIVREMSTCLSVDNT